MLRRFMLIIALLAAFLAAAAAPASAQYQPGQPGFILEPPVVEPGAPTTVIGTGCARGADVTATIDGVVVGTTTAADDDTGSFSIDIDAPETVGDVVVTVTCGDTVMTQILSVVASVCGFSIAGAPGATVTASAPGFQLGTPYTLTFQSDPVQVGSGTVDADPQTVTFTIPSTAVPGDHTLTIAGTSTFGVPKELTCPVVVTEAPVLTANAASTTGTTTATGTLPRTGGDGGQLLKAGALLLAGGGLLVLLARRSPRTT